MDTEATYNYAHIITLAQATFEQVEHDIDVTPQRAILHLQARYGLYRVFITELFSEGLRKYGYYVLRGG